MKLSEVLDEIRKQVGEENLTNSCGGGGCDVDMTDVPHPRIVVDVERVFLVNKRKGRRCDRILFYVDLDSNTLVVVLIELKSGNVDASDVFQQLQGGAKFADEEVIPQNIETTCIPVVFHGKRIHDAQLPKLKRNEVRFRRQTFPIRKGKCGRRTKNLASVLKLAFA